jgi:hypothetical protein
VVGVYHDLITKIDGRWGFEQRFFQAYYKNSDWPGGEAVVDYDYRPQFT